MELPSTINMVARAALLAAACLVHASAQDSTCGDVKTFYKTNGCCGNPSKKVTMPTAEAPACPYNFAKPTCQMAEPQSPRDLSTGAKGDKVPKAAVLNDAQANSLPLANVHFHLGAEHKSDDYKDDTDAKAYDAANDKRRLAANPRPGFMCSNDGLRGAANGRGQLNPQVVVQGQVFQIVQGAATVDDMLHGWSVVGHDNSVMYSGSTTGPSHNNEVCSPYVISWHVDLKCHQVSPESFDNLCKQMNDLYKLEKDLYPHGSRKIVDQAFVVPADYVKPLA